MTGWCFMRREGFPEASMGLTSSRREAGTAPRQRLRVRGSVRGQREDVGERCGMPSEVALCPIRQHKEAGRRRRGDEEPF